MPRGRMIMSRLVWPNYFMLYASERPDALKNPKLPSLLSEIGKISRQSKGQSTTRTMVPANVSSQTHGRTSEGLGTPIALRWSTIPTLGFPRMPFKVWRRPRNYTFTDLQRAPLSFTTALTVDWGLQE